MNTLQIPLSLLIRETHLGSDSELGVDVTESYYGEQAKDGGGSFGKEVWTALTD